MSKGMWGGLSGWRPPDLEREYDYEAKSWVALVQFCEEGSEPYKALASQTETCPKCERPRTVGLIAFVCPDCAHFVNSCEAGHQWTVTIPVGWKQIEAQKQRLGGDA